MENKENILLTDEDKMTIDRLARYLPMMTKKYRSSLSEVEVKEVCIDDLCHEKSLDLLTKIDIYISEIANKSRKGNYDEFWIIQYRNLKDRIKSNLETI